MEVKISKLLGMSDLERRDVNFIKSVGRCTGKTTANALKIIANAMLQPETPIEILDNSHNSLEYQYNLNFVRVVENLIERLGLEHFTITTKGILTVRTLTYNIYSTYRKEEVVTTAWKEIV